MALLKIVVWQQEMISVEARVKCKVKVAAGVVRLRITIVLPFWEVLYIFALRLRG